MLSVKLPEFRPSKNMFHFINNWINKNGTTVFICAFFFIFIVNKNITLQITLSNNLLNKEPNDSPTHLSPVNAVKINLTSKNKPLTKVQILQLKYVDRFAKVAQIEMHKYGIPASIKLAQGLLESDAGRSLLSVKNNNHFGIKCFSKKCSKGHCTNFSDDSHKDFFRVYPNAWESYRAHSLFLNRERYRHLIGEKDYKIWAKGLSKAGYATDRNYAKKLIRLIEDLKLYEYDSPLNK